MISGLYLHVPYCTQKCYYCDFYSRSDTSKLCNYVMALCKEIEIVGNRLKDAIQPETIFIGGGTPSILTPRQMNYIIKALDANIKLSDVKEFTIESNPGTLSEEKLNCYLELGINRLSIGVQSLDDAELRFLQRIHTAEQALDNIALARRLGFANINADVIFSLPGQQWNTFENTLDRLLDCGVDHISAYSLIYEENTGLYDALINGDVAKNDEDEEADIYIKMIEKFANTGHLQYEISNFATENHKCLHNLNYWRRKEYIGFGPSAHSYVNGVRYGNIADTEQYIDSMNKAELPICNQEVLTREEIIEEIFYLGLRAEGLNCRSLSEQYGIDLLSDKAEIINKLIDEKKAYLDDEILKLHPAGYAICDYLAVILSENY